MISQPIYNILVLVVLLLVKNQKWGWLRCKNVCEHTKKPFSP